MRTPPRTPPARAAFTLVEAIIALVILSVAMPPMLWALREAHAARITPMRASTARWLAVEGLETIIADRHSATRGYDYLAPANYPAEPSIAGFPAYSRTIDVAETDADLVSIGTGYTRITVTVAWTDMGNVPRSLSLSTVLTEYP